MSSHTRVSALFSNRNFVADWCNCSERYSYIISILHQSCPLFPSLSSHRRNCSAFPDGFIVSQITKEILNNGIFFPFQPDNANMLLLSIVFCRIQALFLSGSHSWSLCFQSCSIHLLFLSAGWQSCSLRFQYSPIYLLFLSLLGHIHVLFTSDTVLHISICYSFLLGHFTVLFTSNTVLYPFAIPFCSVTFMFSSLPIQSYPFDIPFCCVTLLPIQSYPFAIPFCWVTLLFSSLPIQSYIHLLFLSVRSHSCSLHFQYSPISMCYSSLSWVILCSLRFFHSYYHLELFILWGLSCLSVPQVCPSSISW